MTVAFDTLKLADRLEAAGMPPQQAKGVAAALAETMTANLVTREYLDLRLGEMEARLRGEIATIHAEMAGTATKAELSEAKAEILRWIIGAIGFQTVVIIGAVAALIRLLH
jgi:predicted polyphosphate/ATP-dependent NAD kinase